MPKETILQVKNLSVELDGEKILRNVSFEVSGGDALAVIGPNGAGKTVLFRTLLGLHPYSGTIKWKEGVKIGYVPQKMAMDRTAPITVREFFLLKSVKFWLPKADFVNHLEHEMRLVGLDISIIEKPMGELSGGQLQRILIAWAMLNHPNVLLLDEPTAGVDVGFEDTIYNIIRRLQKERGTTVFLISHDLSIVYRYAQKVICLNKAVVCQGPPSEVLNEKELNKVYGESAYYHHEGNPLR